MYGMHVLLTYLCLLEYNTLQSVSPTTSSRRTAGRLDTRGSGTLGKERERQEYKISEIYFYAECIRKLAGGTFAQK